MRCGLIVECLDRLLETGVGAASGALSMLVGVAVLKAQYENYDLTFAVRSAAIGSAVVGAACLRKAVKHVAAYGVFGGHGSTIYNKSDKPNFASVFGGYVSLNLMGAMLGFGVMKGLSLPFILNLTLSEMSFGQIVAASAVGSSLVAIPITLGLAYCMHRVIAHHQNVYAASLLEDLEAFRDGQAASLQMDRLEPASSSFSPSRR